MTPSNIQLHIERIVLEGFALSGSQSRVLQTALEGELSRLLTDGGLHERFAEGIALRSLPISAVLPADASPAALGRDIARTVYSGIGGMGGNAPSGGEGAK